MSDKTGVDWSQLTADEWATSTNAELARRYGRCAVSVLHARKRHGGPTFAVG